MVVLLVKLNCLTPLHLVRQIDFKDGRPGSEVFVHICTGV